MLFRFEVTFRNHRNVMRTVEVITTTEKEARFVAKNFIGDVSFKIIDVQKFTCDTKKH